jgi:hypothetical protein
VQCTRLGTKQSLSSCYSSNTKLEFVCSLQELEDLLKKQPPSSLRSVPPPKVYMDEKRLTMESSSNDKSKEPSAPAVQEGELVKESDVLNTAEEKFEATKSVR